MQIPIKPKQGIFFNNQSFNTAGDYSFFLNGFFEKLESKSEDEVVYCYTKRPGIFGNTGLTFAAGYRVQGVVSAPNKQTSVFFANNGVTNKGYFLNSSGTLVDKGVCPAAAGAWTATGPVVFTVLDSTTYGGYSFAATDFTKGAVIDSSGVWLELTDVDFTGLTKVSNFVALGGYLFIADNRNRIYNSDLNTPTTWVSTSFISANDIPGTITWLSRLRNYLVVFKQRSIEFFEDAGNPSPGSPLGSVKQLNKSIGCIMPSSIQEVSDGIIFVGVNISGMQKVYKLDKETLSLHVISDRFTDECIASTARNSFTSYAVDPYITNAAIGQSQVFNYGNKEFYGIVVMPPLADKAGIMQVWDNDLLCWTTWTSCTSSTTTDGHSDSLGFLFTQAFVSQTAVTGFYTSCFINNNVATGTVARICYIENSHPLYYDYGADNIQRQFTFSWTSDIFDGKTRKRKFMNSVELLFLSQTNSVPNFANTASVTLSYKDLDFNDTAGYTASRTIYYDPGGAMRSKLYRLGTFRRRVFSLSNNDTNPFVLMGIEVELDVGEESPGRGNNG